MTASGERRAPDQAAPAVPPVTGQPAVRMVATDLDGTFLGPDGQVSGRAAAAVASARATGIHVIPVTARAPLSTRVIAASAGMGPLAVCGNGAVIYDLSAGAVLEHSPLAAEVARRIIEEVRQALPGVLFACETVDVLHPEVGFLEELALAWGIDAPGVRDVSDHLGEAVTKLICRHPDLTQADLLEGVARACGLEAHVTSPGVGWAEVGAPGVTKAYALDRVCDLLDLSVAEVVCVGDERNDLPMLAWARTAVAVANACAEVLAVAGRVVPSNADDGVAQLLEELAAGAEAEAAVSAGGGAGAAVSAGGRRRPR